MNPLRWIALVLLFSGLPVQGAEPAFFYLAVPSAPAKCLFFSCVQFDAQGKLVAQGRKNGAAFTLWRSGYWDEREPDIVIKTEADWSHALEVRARKAVAARPEMGRYPPAMVDFFVAVETLRAAALDTGIVAEPLFRNRNFVGWENASHLNAVAVPDALGPKERSRALLACMGAVEKERGQDPGPWMKGLLTSLGTKVQSARYYPEYNAFVFEAGADFKEAMETLFSPMTGH